MAEQIQGPEPSEPQVREKPLMRCAIIGLIALVIGFAAGFVPAWLSSRQHATQRDAARRHLEFTRVQITLASAAIDARRGDYEPARQAASEFFTALRAEADRPESSLTPAQREALQPIFTQRDNVITLLARSDPAAADRLADIYTAYRKVLQQ
jgi:hypothetical protein